MVNVPKLAVKSPMKERRMKAHAAGQSSVRAGIRRAATLRAVLIARVNKSQHTLETLSCLRFAKPMCGY